MNNCFEQGEGLVFLFLNFRKMPINQIIEKGLSHGLVTLEGCKLKGSHPDVRACDTG